MSDSGISDRFWMQFFIIKSFDKRNLFRKAKTPLWVNHVHCYKTVNWPIGPILDTLFFIIVFKSCSLPCWSSVVAGNPSSLFVYLAYCLSLALDLSYPGEKQSLLLHALCWGTTSDKEFLLFFFLRVSALNGERPINVVVAFLSLTIITIIYWVLLCLRQVCVPKALWDQTNINKERHTEVYCTGKQGEPGGGVHAPQNLEFPKGFVYAC